MRGFIRAHTTLASAPLVPGIVLHLATEITPIWHATEAWVVSLTLTPMMAAWLEREGVAPPFWAFAWPGSQALARHVLDNPGLIAGRRVLDFAAGCGLAAIACARAGASHVEAAEIDPMAVEAIAMNAELNGVTVHGLSDDIIGAPCRWDLILCGDVCYEAPMTRHILPWLRTMAAVADVWIADPGRAYVPDGMACLANYAVTTSMELEDRTVRHTRLLRLRPG